MSTLKGSFSRYNQFGHQAAHCPTRRLAIDTQEEDKNEEIEEKTYDAPIINDVAEEEGQYEQMAMIKLPQPNKSYLGVVRCAIAQPQP